MREVYDLLLDVLKLIVAGVAGGGLMGGIVALRKQRSEEPLTAAQVAESTSSTIGEGYKALLAEQRASADRTIQQLQRTEQRLTAMDEKIAAQNLRIDDLEATLEDRNRRLSIWEMWHKHNLTPNWERLRGLDTPPPPPSASPSELSPEERTNGQHRYQG